MEFNTIEACCFCILCADPESFDDVGDFFGFQGSRYWIRPLRSQQTDMTLGGNRTGCNWDFTVQEAGVGNPTDMPELQEYLTAVFMHCLGNIAPTSHLSVRPNSGGVSVTDAQCSHRGGLTDDQTG
ncbi:hypothetical protein D3C76_1159670 [compost metagenome]